MKHYPCMIYRYQTGVYGNATINFVDDELLQPEGKGVTIHWKGQVYDEAGEITPKCRELLRAFGIKQKKESRFRLCIVYGPDDCDYFEPEGVVNHSKQPPYSTLTLTDGEYESEWDLASGSLDLKLTKIDDSGNTGVKNGNRTHSLGGADKLLAILVIVTAFIYSGCLAGRAEGNAQQSDRSGTQNGNVNTNSRLPTNRKSESNKKSPVPTAICRDGSLSHSASPSGTCSHHGGVEKWLVRRLK